MFIRLPRTSLKRLRKSNRLSFIWFYYRLKRFVQAYSEMFRLAKYENRQISLSICTTVRGRFEHLEKTYIRNIKNNCKYNNCEFVLLNYGCPDPRTELWVKTKLKPYIDSGKVKYYCYPSAKKYSFSHSRNLAFRLSSGEVVCNVDADNYIGRGFVNYLSSMFNYHESIYIRGPSDGRDLAGRIAVKRSDWKSVGGYDERIVDYGADDSDFSNRLTLLGLEKKIILRDSFCRTISHSDDLRIATSATVRESIKRNLVTSEENRSKKILNPNGSNFGLGVVRSSCANKK